MKSHVEADIGAAAFLLARGFQLLGLELLGRNRFGFVFGDEERGADRAVRDYFDGAAAQSKRLMDSLRMLKDRLYAEKGWNGNGNQYRSYQHE